MRLHRARKELQAEGFTLIELLVVILIISIVSGSALLTIGSNPHKQMKILADELAQYMQLAEEQALLEPTIIGLLFHEQKYTFMRWGMNANGEKSWITITEPPFAQRHISSNFSMTLKLQNQNANSESSREAGPQIIFSTNGTVTPFILYIGKCGGEPQYRISGEADGAIDVSSLS